MRSAISVAAFVAVCVVPSSLAAPPAAPANDRLPALEHWSPAQADPSVDACTDFFQHACGTWMKANPIPADQAASGTFDKLFLWNVAAVHRTLEEAVTATTRTPVQQKAGDYYAACMDEAAIDRAGLAPLQPLLDRIGKLADKSQLPEVLASIHEVIRPPNLNFIEAQSPGVLFGVWATPDFDDATSMLAALDQSGMGLPGREFYLNDDAKSQEIRAQYAAYVTRILALSGESAEQAASDAKGVLAIETALARSAMDIVARRDPKNLNNKRTLTEVQSLTLSFEWPRYFAAIHAPASPRYVVLSPDFFRGVEELIKAQPVASWRAYLRYSMLRMSAPALSKAFVDENFDFFGRRLSGTQENQPRWRRCSITADVDLGEAVGQAYVARYFPPGNKARMLAMVKDIEAALHADIDAAVWMSDATRKRAHAKLAAQVDKIGYPDRWLDYSSLRIEPGDHIGNVQRASRFEFERRLARLGKRADRSEWGMTPPTVNAYEDGQSNTINFPAGILQPPFFDAEQNDSVNYGAIGSVIGHEVVHGFDDQGRKFDGDGNLRDWWTAEDAASYEERDRCITDQYTQDVPEAGPGVKQNGKLSAGEDTADNGGVHLALDALRAALAKQGQTLQARTDSGLTQAQTFFLAYANVWCGEVRPEAARTAVMTQGHSLGRYRINNVVANMPEFAEAFGCKAGQPMVHAPACRVW